MEKIILTGSEGLIGKKIYNFLKNLKLGLDIKKGDLVNEKVLDILKKNKDAKYLINFMDIMIIIS